jgi:hypothetical protein
LFCTLELGARFIVPADIWEYTPKGNICQYLFSNFFRIFFSAKSKEAILAPAANRVKEMPLFALLLPFGYLR